MLQEQLLSDQIIVRGHSQLSESTHFTPGFRHWVPQAASLARRNAGGCRCAKGGGRISEQKSIENRYKLNKLPPEQKVN